MTKMGGVLFIAGDPGGAAALLPVIVAWPGERQVVAYKQAVNFFRKAGLDVVALDGIAASTSAAEGCISRSGAALLVTATSVNGVEWEPHFIVAARRSGVSSISVLDYWSNYTPRFSLDRPLDALPNAIAVMDERAVEEMSAEGFPSASLIITGQPVLDLAREWRAGLAEGDRGRFRESLGLHSGQQAFLFVSQPLREVRTATGTTTDEHDEFSALSALLEAFRQEACETAVLLLKTHPRELPGKFDSILSDLPFAALTVDPAVHRWEVCVAADCVLGVSSMLIEEARVMGCPVQRIQRGVLPCLTQKAPGTGLLPGSPGTSAVSRIKELMGRVLAGG